ncbi:MAG TPA: hypothetical protein VHA52_11935, partial [Candidatus Babeliaceae bacterium]|nr:hypothetical protein [Candidatus Babeliaceae bacterium]
YRNTIPNASAAVFKRINGMEKWIRPDMKFAGDWYFWIQLLRNGNITYSPSPMNFFRRHSFSTRQQQSFDQEIRRLKEYFAVICDGFKITRKGLCNYDWVIDEWLSRKKAFSHKPEFFFPPFPTMMFMRFYWKLLRYSNRREFSL